MGFRLLLDPAIIGGRSHFKRGKLISLLPVPLPLSKKRCGWRRVYSPHPSIAQFRYVRPNLLKDRLKPAPGSYLWLWAHNPDHSTRHVFKPISYLDEMMKVCKSFPKAEVQTQHCTGFSYIVSLQWNALTIRQPVTKSNPYQWDFHIFLCLNGGYGLVVHNWQWWPYCKKWRSISFTFGIIPYLSWAACSHTW